MKQSDNIYLAPQKKLDFVPIVEKECGLKKDQIYIRTNRRIISRARQIAIWLQYNENMANFKTPRLYDIAKKYPGRRKPFLDHSSVIHSYRTVNDIMDVDRHFRAFVFKIQEKIWGEIKYTN